MVKPIRKSRTYSSVRAPEEWSLLHTKAFIMELNDILTSVMGNSFALEEVKEGQHSLLDLMRHMEQLIQCVIKINDTTMAIQSELAISLANRTTERVYGRRVDKLFEPITSNTILGKKMLADTILPGHYLVIVT
jgi:hypothetical protein